MSKDQVLKYLELQEQGYRVTKETAELVGYSGKEPQRLLRQDLRRNGYESSGDGYYIKKDSCEDKSEHNSADTSKSNTVRTKSSTSGSTTGHTKKSDSKSIPNCADSSDSNCGDRINGDNCDDNSNPNCGDNLKSNIVQTNGSTSGSTTGHTKKSDSKSMSNCADSSDSNCGDRINGDNCDDNSNPNCGDKSNTLNDETIKKLLTLAENFDNIISNTSSNTFGDASNKITPCKSPTAQTIKVDHDVWQKFRKFAKASDYKQQDLLTTALELLMDSMGQ